MLEDMGHAALREEAGRKVYALTDAGRAELDAHKGAVDQFYDRFEPDDWNDPAEDVADLMRTVARLLRMFRRAARRGRMAPEVVRVVREALDDALRKIEAALDERR
jgi:DNA-binding PadR family transcriptional regulator